MSIDHKTQLKLKLEGQEEEKILLCFDNSNQKKEYVKLLKQSREANPVAETETEANPNPVAEKWTAKKGEVEVEAEGEVEEEGQVEIITEEQMESLRRLGWLKDKDKTETETETQKRPKTKAVPRQLKPDTKQVSYVRYSHSDGELYKVKMGSPIAAATANLLIQVQEPSPELYKEITRLQGMTGDGALSTFHGLIKDLYHKEDTPFDVVDALSLAYQAALEESEEMLGKLLSTGEAILQYQTGEDDFLGTVKQYNDQVGYNLVGHVLMSLRASLGGMPDVRIDLVRGQREYPWGELQPDPDFFGDEGLKALSENQARMFLGKRSESSEKRAAAWDEAYNELTKFIVGKSWWPFPVFPDEVVVVQSKGTFRSNNCDEFLNWIDFSALSGVQFIGAKTHSALGGKYLQSLEVLRLGKDRNHQLKPYNVLEDSTKMHLYLSEGLDWWSAYLSEVTAHLDSQDLTELFGILAKATRGVAKYEINGGKVTLTSNSEVYTWNFYNSSVDARQYRKAFKTTIIGGKPVSSKWSLLWLALCCLKNFKGINGVMNNIPNFWEREANYGHPWEFNHPTRVIRDNSGAPIRWAKASGPFKMMVKNDTFNYHLFLDLVATKHFRYDAYTDKNGLKLLAGKGAGAAALTSLRYSELAEIGFDCLDLGVHPLLVLPILLNQETMFRSLIRLLSGTNPALILMEEFGWFCTANDGAKVTKFLNRAQQGGSWNEAYAWVTWKGKEFTRQQSLMAVRVDWDPNWQKATEADEAALLEWLS